MTHVLRITLLRIAHHVANPEVGKREVHPNTWPIGQIHKRYNKEYLRIQPPKKEMTFSNIDSFD